MERNCSSLLPSFYFLLLISICSYTHMPQLLIAESSSRPEIVPASCVRRTIHNVVVVLNGIFSTGTEATENAILR